MTDILDPLLDATSKGFPQSSAPLRRSAIGAQGWNVLAGDLPLPLAVVKRDALQHNLGWMQRFADDAGVRLAPHGKTTMSPQLFRRQLDAGAWGLSFATVAQLRIGVEAGARRALIANQVLDAGDLAAIGALQAEHAGLRVLFLIDSAAQLELIEATRPERPFEVLLEIGVPGGRSGCRTHDEALALARRARASTALRLAGIECYEGLGVKGDTEFDRANADALMARVNEIALECDREQLFEADEVLVSAGGSAIFDLVVPALRPALSRPVVGLLRSGCYVTHDHGHYRRLVAVANLRLGCDVGLQAALEVWALVQSVPEPGLAILAVGRRDLSYDIELPIPIAHAARGGREVQTAPADWKISGLNDQHAYMRFDGEPGLAVGDRIVLGISHPCTTFDKWRWMPVVDADYRVVDALVTCF
ncbi:MAG TPA: amino acid deaminase [Rubrivivax sp.]